MVGEFPELQGVMGRYYALHDGEPADVAQAIVEHYQPRFAGDVLPQTECGTLLALADKLETLAGMFAIGQFPTGDKDPFALRRHALGVIRILIEKRLSLSLPALINAAFSAFGDRVKPAPVELETFLHERLSGYLRERGYNAQETASVVEQRPADLARVPDRLEAVRAFSQLPQAQALAAAISESATCCGNPAPKLRLSPTPRGSSNPPRWRWVKRFRDSSPRSRRGWACTTMALRLPCSPRPANLSIASLMQSWSWLTTRCCAPIGLRCLPACTP